MRRPHITYPKLTLFFVLIIVSIVFFKYVQTHNAVYDFIMSFGYVGTFFAWFFYTSGFTAVPATTILLLLSSEQGFFLTWIIASIGAVLGDVALILFVKHSFSDEIDKITEESTVLRWISLLSQEIAGKYYKHLLPMIAGILISSPLPTEVWITLMSWMKKLSFRYFVSIVWILHIIGIFVILFFTQ